MPILEYTHKDASAPVLTGQAGSLISLLDACLVNGYGTKAAAGWSKEFTGTNLAVYRAPQGNRFRLRVDDTTTNSSRVAAFEAMTDVNTGTNRFPTSAQAASGYFWPKSKTTDATARVWRLYADEKRFWLIVDPSQSSEFGSIASVSSMHPVFFGDLNALSGTDAYCTALFGDSNSASATTSEINFLGRSNATLSAGTHGAIARSPDGATFSVAPTLSSMVHQTYSGGGAGGYYPSTGTNGLALWKMFVADPNAIPRAHLPGYLAVEAFLPESCGDRLTYGGIDYLLVDVATESSTLARFALQVSGNW